MSEIKEAQERYEAAKSRWSTVYADAKDDQLFYGGEQWDKADLSARGARPTLTTSHLQQFVHQVANEIRLNTPVIKVLPIDDGADVEGAKMRQGLIKSIETISSADVAYETAAENAIISSFGFIRLDHDYIAPDKFEQHILVKTVNNPMSAVIDPASIMPDGSDAQFGFVLDAIPKKDFKKQFKGKDAVSFGEVRETDEEDVVIAEYFFIVTERVEIGLMPDGRVMEVEQAAALGLPPVKTRWIEKNRVKRQKMSGADILEETYFPGSFIPIVPVYGEVRWIDGKREIWSLIRNAKDAQRMINYYSSLEIESLSKAPQAPFIGPAGSFADHEDQWRNPQKSMVLEWTPVYDANGQLLPPPQRLMPPQIPTGAVNAKRDAIEEMKAAMGLFAANLGQPSNETSGKAIDKRQQQGQIATAHFGDNLNKSIQHVGRIILSMMPEIYDTPRVVRVIGAENEAEAVEINNGGLYDINSGRYDVAVVAGPGFMTRRQEAQDMMTMIMQTNPQLVQVMGDLFFKYSDVPGADVIAARLRNTIPPELLKGDASGAKGEPPFDPEKEQMGKMLVEQRQALQEAQMGLQDKTFEQQIKAGELEIKKIELQIKAHQAAMQSLGDKPRPPSEGEGQGEDMAINETGESIEVLQAKLQQRIAEKQQAEQAALEQQYAQEQAQLAAQQQLAQAAAEKEEQRARSDALLQGLSDIQRSIGALIGAIQQPKQVVRDENNMIVGVK